MLSTRLTQPKNSALILWNTLPPGSKCTAWDISWTLRDTDFTEMFRFNLYVTDSRRIPFTFYSVDILWLKLELGNQAFMIFQNSTKLSISYFLTFNQTAIAPKLLLIFIICQSFRLPVVLPFLYWLMKTNYRLATLLPVTYPLPL